MHRFVRARDGIPYFYDRGGIVRSGAPIRVTIALDECILVRRDGAYRCARNDAAHLATHPQQGDRAKWPATTTALRPGTT
ncbi:hypothetical protein [Nocardia carnea]|uniref:hypothetical protein n=1 Tax=Nocardia carnea TaxID=37328 RepID=UPI0024576DB0|nr:hypothetical protein [Nocardia carnea]